MLVASLVPTPTSPLPFALSPPVALDTVSARLVRLCSSSLPSLAPRLALVLLREVWPPHSRLLNILVDNADSHLHRTDSRSSLCRCVLTFATAHPRARRALRASLAATPLAGLNPCRPRPGSASQRADGQTLVQPLFTFLVPSTAFYPLTTNAMAIDAAPAVPGQKKQIKWSNIALGGIMNMFEVRYLSLADPQGPSETRSGLFPFPLSLSTIQASRETDLPRTVVLGRSRPSGSRSRSSRRRWRPRAAIRCRRRSRRSGLAAVFSAVRSLASFSLLAPRKDSTDTCRLPPHSLPGPDPLGVDRSLDQGRRPPLRGGRDPERGHDGGRRSCGGRSARRHGWRCRAGIRDGRCVERSSASHSRETLIYRVVGC